MLLENSPGPPLETQKWTPIQRYLANSRGVSIDQGFNPITFPNLETLNPEPVNRYNIFFSFPVVLRVGMEYEKCIMLNTCIPSAT